jgi:hypothetical protein
MKMLLIVFFLGLLGCTTRETTSGLRVTNGLVDFGDPFVVMIVSYDFSSDNTSDAPSGGVSDLAHREIGRCSASYVAPDILLTAAHCIVKKGTQQARLIKTAGSHSREMIAYRIHPDYFTENQTDLALIALEKSKNNPPHAPLSPKAPGSGEQVRVIGFGGNQYTEEKGVILGRGVKRFGFNSIAYSDPKYLYSKGYRHGMAPGSSRPTGVSSALAHGDSGGPMVNSQNEIVGVASKILEVKDPKDESQAILVAHTRVDFSMEFIKKSIEELQK